MAETILIVAPEAPALRAVEALRGELAVEVGVAPNRRAGLAQVRRQEYALVLLDEGLAAADPEAAAMLYQNAGTATVLELNFAITGTARIVRAVRGALLRRTQEQQLARRQAAEALQHELSGTLSGLLLEAQLSLRDATPAQSPRLRHLVALAGELRERLLTP